MKQRKRNQGMPRNRKWEDGWLTAWHGTDEDGEGPDTVSSAPNSPDARFLLHVLCDPRYDHKGERQPSILEELKARGYQVETLRFELKRNRKPNEPTPL